MEIVRRWDKRDNVSVSFQRGCREIRHRVLRASLLVGFIESKFKLQVKIGEKRFAMETDSHVRYLGGGVM